MALVRPYRPSDLGRRSVLKGVTAGLSLCLPLGPPPRAEGETSPVPFSPVIWVNIATDGIITIVSPAAELGQGSFTSVPLILADELDADWNSVRLVQPSAQDGKLFGNPAYGYIFQTSSSASIRGYYQPLRLVGAQARRILMDAVADKWGVQLAELTTRPSVVVHERSGRQIGYGDVAGFAAAPASLPAITEQDLKPAASFRYIGHDVPRSEVPLKVTGKATYGIDLQRPGMLYAAVLHPHSDGCAPETIDDTAARNVPGIVQIVRLPDGVGIVGTSFKATQAAKSRLSVTWTTAQGDTLDSELALEAMAATGRDLARPGVVFSEAGDAKASLRVAAKTYVAEYRTRYLYHGQMEPMNATAAFSSDGRSLEIWAGTNAPTELLQFVANALALDPSRITFHQQLAGGSYGRRNSHETVIDAARIARAAGAAVKLILSREDDVAYGKFRPATAHRLEAGLDAGGRVIAWHHRVVAESIYAYMYGDPRPRPDRMVMKGAPVAQYPFPHKLAEHVIEPQGARISPLRGVGNAYNAFAAESFIDEIALDQQQDPIAFRMRLCEGVPRMQRLISVVAEMSGWHQPRQSTALGVGTMVKDDTLAAGVAEISVDKATGVIKVHAFWAAIDAGLAVQPGNIAAPTEGSIIFALGHVLREKIVIRAGQSSFTDYEVPRMSDVPIIEVRVISTDNPPTGGGEHGAPLVACAVGNAFAKLTGIWLRELPFDPDRVLSAFGA